MKNYQLLRSVLELINLCESIEEVRELTQQLLNETNSSDQTPVNNYTDKLTQAPSDTFHPLAG